jgi:hypothetical protein
MLQVAVAGAITRGCRCCDLGTTVLQATVVGAAEDVGDATGGRWCCNEPTTVLPLACSVATKRWQRRYERQVVALSGMVAGATEEVVCCWKW